MPGQGDTLSRHFLDYYDVGSGIFPPADVTDHFIARQFPQYYKRRFWLCFIPSPFY